MNINEECLLNFLSNPEEINEIFKSLCATFPDVIKTVDAKYFVPNIIL